MTRMHLLAAAAILAAVSSLRSDPPAADLEKLTVQLTDQRADVRKSAIEELARRGAEAAPAIPALMRSLGDQREEVRIVATVALANIGSDARTAVPQLRKVLRDDSSAAVKGW